MAELDLPDRIMVGVGKANAELPDLSVSTPTEQRKVCPSPYPVGFS